MLLNLPRFKYFRIRHDLDSRTRWGDRHNLIWGSSIVFYGPDNTICKYDMELGPQTINLPFVFNDLSEITREHELKLLATAATFSYYRRMLWHDTEVHYQGETFWLRQRNGFLIGTDGTGRYCMVVARPDDVVSRS